MLLIYSGPRTNTHCSEWGQMLEIILTLEKSRMFVIYNDLPNSIKSLSKIYIMLSFTAPSTELSIC